MTKQNIDPNDLFINPPSMSNLLEIKEVKSIDPSPDVTKVEYPLLNESESSEENMFAAIKIEGLPPPMKGVVVEGDENSEERRNEFIEKARKYNQETPYIKMKPEADQNPKPFIDKKALEEAEQAGLRKMMAGLKVSRLKSEPRAMNLPKSEPSQNLFREKKKQEFLKMSKELDHLNLVKPPTISKKELKRNTSTEKIKTEEKGKLSKEALKAERAKFKMDLMKGISDFPNFDNVVIPGLDVNPVKVPALRKKDEQKK